MDDLKITDVWLSRPAPGRGGPHLEYTCDPPGWTLEARDFLLGDLAEPVCIALSEKKPRPRPDAVERRGPEDNDGTNRKRSRRHGGRNGTPGIGMIILPLGFQASRRRGRVP